MRRVPGRHRGREIDGAAIGARIVAGRHGRGRFAIGDGGAASAFLYMGAFSLPFRKVRLDLAGSRPSGDSGPMAGFILPHSGAEVGDPTPAASATTPQGTLRTRGVVGGPRGPAQQVTVTLATRSYGRTDEASVALAMRCASVADKSSLATAVSTDPPGGGTHRPVLSPSAQQAR
jgi:hypothetical protein